MRQGDKLAELEAAAKQEGPIGDAVRKDLEQRPQLSSYERDVLDAFFFLGTSRLHGGMGVGGIPLSAIREYVDWCEMPRTMGELFVIYINLLDRVYINAKNSEAAKSSK